MQLNPSEISDLIKSKIQNLQLAATARTEGTVVSVTDGICRVHGLADVMQGEMLEFPGNTFGLAMNLERDSVGASFSANTSTSPKATPSSARAASSKCRSAPSCSAAW
jgi:F0F1-type ATP synthase alpha subunit